MADRDQGMKGLECLAGMNEMKSNPCMDCGYQECQTYAICIGEIARDALTLLKAQEPRVMTLEEVVKHYSLPPVVLDDISWKQDYLQDIEPLYFDFPVDDSWAVHWRGYEQVRKYIDDWKASYGQKWLCWTSRPTDEQRKAVKWE